MSEPASKKAPATPGLRAVLPGTRPNCPLCGTAGHVAHEPLPDRFFGSPGSWSFRTCPDETCELAWIDPLPSKNELAEAYSGYYTHAAPRTKAPLLRPIYDRMKRGFLAQGLGYDKGVTDLERRLGFFARFLPEARHQMDAAAMHLPASQRGRILEIGCGNGNILTQLAALGWEAWGVDLDSRAVEEARKHGATDVRAGVLEDQHYPPDHFDAIASVHALEHIPDPLALFEECARILRPGGHLVVSTPNWNCLTHSEFGTYWRGLEPPRHLHLFNRRSLRSILERSGFSLVSIATTSRGAAYGHRTSSAAKCPQTSAVFRAVAARVHSIRVCGRLSIDPDAGDELLAIAVRR